VTWVRVINGYNRSYFELVTTNIYSALNISPEIKVLLVTAIAYLTKTFFTGTKTDENKE
jgi:hypothetical protein